MTTATAARRTRVRHQAPDAPYIVASLRALAVPILDLTPNPENARLHDDADLLVISSSLRAYGQQKPVVARREHRGMSNVVLAGNGTLLAARAIGWDFLATSWFTGTDDEADEYQLVDNRAGEVSTWDYAKLVPALRAVASRQGEGKVRMLGWQDDEYRALVDGTGPGTDQATGRATGQHHIVLTAEMYEVVGAAIARLRHGADGDESMSEGRAVELICADYLAGNS